MKKLLSIILVFISVSTYAQELKPLLYKLNDKSYTGYYVTPESVNESTKTILIVHEWWGLNDYPKKRAIQLANEGYIAVCLDMYGTNIIATNPQSASKLAGELYANREMAYEIFKAGYEAAKTVQGVNPDKMAAIGYCFGGNIVLNVAKMGAPLDAVVSFHGNLSGPVIEKEKFTAAVLICNGAADTYVPVSEIDAMIKDLEVNGINYKFINYEGAVHAFTNPASTEAGRKFKLQIAYSEEADKKSYQDFIRFIEQTVK